MVKRIEYYECEICNSHSATETAARECEANGLIIPKFKVFEVVRVNGRLGIILECGYLGSSPHQRMMGYAVWIKRFFGTGEKRLFVDQIEKYPFVDRHCPLCKSQKLELLKGGTLGPFTPHPSNKFVVVNEIELYYCLKCGAEFHNEEQSKKIDEIIRQTAKYPIKAPF